MVYLRVDELLKEKNKSTYWLVKKMESTYPNINPLLRRETTSIHFETLYKLCKIFECTPGELFALED